MSPDPNSFVGASSSTSNVSLLKKLKMSDQREHCRANSKTKRKFSYMGGTFKIKTFSEFLFHQERAL
jgi:hypothetical protein